MDLKHNCYPKKSVITVITVYLHQQSSIVVVDAGILKNLNNVSLNNKLKEIVILLIR